MRLAAGATLAVLVLAAALPGRVAAQSECTMSLDESVLVGSGEHRDCGVWVVGHDATVARGAVVGGGVNVAYGHAAVDGEVAGSVNVFGGDAAITGRVRGDVYASGIVRLDGSARVHGNVTGREVDAAAGATVDGSTVELQRGWAGMPRSGRRLGDGARLLFRALVTLLLAGVFGGLAALSMPGFVERLRHGARPRPGAVLVCVAIGVVCLVLTGVVLWTLWRQPVTYVVALAPASLALIGALGIGGRLGAWTLPRRHPALQTGVGVAIVTLAATAVLPLEHWVFFCAGGLLFVFVGAWSIGVAVRTLIPRRVRPTAAEPVAPVLDPVATRPSPDVEPSQVPSAPAAPSSPYAGPADPAAPAAVPPLRPPHGDLPSAESGTPPPEPTDRVSALELRRIPGISPIYAHLLAAAGIPSLVELADRDPDDVVACLAVPGVLAVDRETATLWVEMARRRLGR